MSLHGFAKYAKTMPNSKKGTYLTPIGQLHTLAAKMSLAWNMEREVGILPTTEGMAMKDLKEQRKVRSMSKGEGP